VTLVGITGDELAGYLSTHSDRDATAVRWLMRLLVSKVLLRENPMTRAAYVPRQRPEELQTPRSRSLRDFGTALALSPITVRHYVYDSIRFCSWCQARGTDPGGAERSDVLAYLAAFRELGMGASSIERRFAGVRFYHRWLIEERGARQDDPTAGIRVPRASHVPKKPYTAEELSRLLAACERLQERALLLLLIDTGLRLREITSLRRTDIDRGRCLIRVRMGKGRGGAGKERVVAATPRALDAFDACCADAGGNHPWRSQLTGGPLTGDGLARIIKAVGRRAGVPGVHAHRFRTTFAVRFLERSGDIQALQLLMGHTKIEVTANYARWGAEQRALEAQRGIIAGWSRELAGGSNVDGLHAGITA
jgi:site-specific recombinase XerD